jgi:hypothetical protein
MRRAATEVRDVIGGRTVTHLHLRQRVTAVVLTTVAVAIAGSVLVLLFERHAKGTAIHDLGDSFFWVSAQLLTVSSQMPNPFTTGGRITDLVLEAWAITVVATLAGSFGAFFHHRSTERKRQAEAS